MGVAWGVQRDDFRPVGGELPQDFVGVLGVTPGGRSAVACQPVQQFRRLVRRVSGQAGEGVNLGAAVDLGGGGVQRDHADYAASMAMSVEDCTATYTHT